MEAPGALLELRKLVILLVVAVAALLVGCGQPNTTASNPTMTQSAAGPFEYAGFWACVDPDDARILVAVTEANPGDYSVIVAVGSAAGESNTLRYEHGAVDGRVLRWPGGFTLSASTNPDRVLLSVEKPGAKVNPILATRQQPGSPVDWDSL